MLMIAKVVSRSSANKETLETGWSNQLLYPRTLAALDQGNRDLSPGACPLISCCHNDLLEDSLGPANWH